MEFTAKEMEIICIFHSGIRSKTLAFMRNAMMGYDHSERKANAKPQLIEV